MKKVFIAISALVLFATSPSFAGKNVIEILSAPAIQPAVKYVGSDETGSSYLVTLNAPEAVKFDVQIKDRTGMVLFTKSFEASNFSKTFKVVDEDNNTSELTISIITTDGKVNSFKVSTEEKSITEISVVKEN